MELDMAIVKYYMVKGCSIKYTLFTDALNKAIQKYPGRAQENIETYYTTKKKWKELN
jgi:hypothetical protein